jgi:hypothetical protein
MGEVAQACELMKQALEILDAQGAYQSAGMLDLAIQRLPDGATETSDPDGVADLSSQS